MEKVKAQIPFRVVETLKKQQPKESSLKAMKENSLMSEESQATDCKQKRKVKKRRKR